MTGPPSTEKTLPNATFREAKMTCSSAMAYPVSFAKRFTPGLKKFHSVAARETIVASENDLIDTGRDQ